MVSDSLNKIDLTVESLALGYMVQARCRVVFFCCLPASLALARFEALSRGILCHLGPTLLKLVKTSCVVYN